MSKKLIKLGIALSTISLFIGQNKPAQALVFNFDYSYDTEGFFSGTDGTTRRNTLELAADYFEPLADNLSAINSSETDTWTPTFTHPGNGTVSYTDATLKDLNIPADTLVIFVGGQDLSGSLGLGGPGGFSWSGSTSFGNTVEARGQTGALNSPATDFGPWGGSLSFDNTVTWNSDGGAPAAGENDLLSVAIHELAHLLGYGTADSWNNLVSGNNFTGDNSVDVYNNFLTSATSVPLADNAHWANNLNSLSGIPEPALDPSLTVGTRKLLTDLDYAGLADIGWDTSAVAAVPFEFSPGLGILLMSGLFGVKQACQKIKHREQLN
jgi:hypothetical protein